MNLQFQTAFIADKIDPVNAVIRGVSVITGGLIAKGHDLEVDGVTLAEMHACAVAKGQVPVKVDHRSGAAAVCGFLTNFQLVGNKLKADWNLLQSHPQRDQILETAQRMPRGVGLSASFVSPDDAPRGKARCLELISVDYVTLPAANPDGMFSRADDRDGGNRPALRRQTDSVATDVERPVPRIDETLALVRSRRQPLVRRVGNRLLKVGVGTAGGFLIGKKYGAAAGAATGTAAGLFFSDSVPRFANRRAAMACDQPLQHMTTITLANQLHAVVDRESAGDLVGKLESHDLHSLSRRILAPSSLVENLLRDGVLRAEHPTIKGDATGRHAFTSDNLNAVKRGVLSAVVERVVEFSTNEADVPAAVARAVREHRITFEAKPKVTEFGRFPDGLVQLSRYVREEEPSAVAKAATLAGAGAAVYGVGSYVRGRAPGRSPFAALRAGHAANVGDARKLANYVRPGVAKAANTGADFLRTASNAARRAGEAVLINKRRLK